MAADKVSAIYSYVKPDGSKESKSVTNFLPDADNGAINAFCTALNGLTNNTLSSVEKIERTDVTANSVVKYPQTFVHNGDTDAVKAMRIGTPGQHVHIFSKPTYASNGFGVLIPYVGSSNTPFNGNIYFNAMYGNDNNAYASYDLSGLLSLADPPSEVTIRFFFEENERSRFTTYDLKIYTDKDAQMFVSYRDEDMLL